MGMEDISPPVSGSSSRGLTFAGMNRWRMIIGLAALLFVGGFLLYQGFSGEEMHLREAYSRVSLIVEEKISHSAAIAVRIPKSMTIGIAQASEKITFEPAITGSWSQGQGDTLIFRPAIPLRAGEYYSIILSSDGATVQQDFLADENPIIEAIFPHESQEAHENSEITILFNRPMVPLTTLDTLLEKDIPIDILPSTAGRWKWITTRNLQFVPEKRLKRSTRYTVAVRTGLISMDGLPVEGKTHTFNTRPLRYEHLSSGLTLTAEPVRITFNQPVDLEKTKAQISVFRSGNDRIPFVAEYGTRDLYDHESGKQRTYLDKSVILIFAKEDRHGREKLWDFKTSYRLAISGAHPLEGDIALGEAREISINVPDIIESLGAQSSRSDFVEPDLFDPQGTLIVRFFEEIDKDRTLISAANLKAVAYGEKCKEENGEFVRYRRDCTKTKDRKTLILSFVPEGLDHGQEIPIVFGRVTNTNGLILNPEPVVKTIRTYPDLVIHKTTPSSGHASADLTKLVLCTSTPLTPADEKNFSERLRSNLTVGLWNWHSPLRVTIGMQSPCALGQFENTIHYGLIPESPYEMSLSLLDDFGQSAGVSLSFRSGPVPEMYRNIFSMQKRYNVTTPARTRLTFAAENLEYLNLHICEVDKKTMLEYLAESPGPEVAPAALPCFSTREDKIELPKSYWTRNFFHVDLGRYLPNPIGHYVISLGHPEYRRIQYRWNKKKGTQERIPQGPIYERTLVTVTNLAVQEKAVEWREYKSSARNQSRANEKLKDELSDSPQNLYWVSEIGSLNPVDGATVEVYRGGESIYTSKAEKLERMGIAFTDEKGIARTIGYPNLYAAIVTKGQDSAIVSRSTDRLLWSSSASGVERAYIYTDRPIYRPGQKVYIKGIHRVGYDARYESLAGVKEKITITNARGEKALEIPVTINEFGTFGAEYTIDADAPLGTYSIRGPGGSGFFEVEEYVGAAFGLDVRTNQDEYIAGDTMELRVDADYYFGVPVEEGSEVVWALTSQDYFFDRYDDGRFQFGNPWYVSYDSPYGDRFIRRGRANLNRAGETKIMLPLDFNSFFQGEDARKSKIFVASITVKNRNGQSVSAEKSFIVHRGEYYLGVDADPSFFAKNQPVTLRVKSVDTKGKEVSVLNGTVEIDKITWEHFRRREVDGRYYYKSEQKKTRVKEFGFSTDSSGNFEIPLTIQEEGQYEITARSGDGRRNDIIASTHTYVYGEKQVSIHPTNNETLDLATDKSELDVGETASIIIQSPYARAKALVSFERSGIFDYRILDIDKNFFEFSFTAEVRHIPNVYTTVLLLSPDPEIKFGQINYSVNTREKELDIEIKTDKSQYLPGERVSLDIFARDRHDRPAQAELSLAVADLSVLALKGNPKKNPVVFFYGRMPLTVMTSSNIKNILEEVEIPAGTKGGGGAGNPEDLSRRKRGEFRDTAHWTGAAVTDNAGRAHISFTLPDNLTTWQAEALGVTTDTKLGAGYGEFIARKELMTIPLRPRFIIPGDEFFVGAKIFNQTGSLQNLEVSIDSPTLILNNETTRMIALPAGETTTIYFGVQAPTDIRDGMHRFTVSAKNASYEDTVENAIPVKRNNTYESTATAHFTNDEVRKEFILLPDNVEPDRGGLTITTSATLAVFLSDALKYLMEYPYGCSEQVVSKLASLAIVKRGLNIENVGDKFDLGDIEFQGERYSLDEVVDIGLARVYENQQPDGGFSYYQWRPTDYWLTLHVVNALVDLQEAGFHVDKNVILRGSQYLYSHITTDPKINQSHDAVIIAAYTISRIKGFIPPTGVLSARVSMIAQNKQITSEKLSNTSLSYLSMVLARGSYEKQLVDGVYKTLENRIVIDARGAHVPVGREGLLWEYYETSVKDTALLLKALVADKREHPLQDKIIRWVLKSRSKDGAWGSTNNTLAVVDAFGDFLSWKRETESNYELKVTLGDAQIGAFDINADTVLNNFSSFTPAWKIPRGTLTSLEFKKTNRTEKAPNTFYYDMSLKYFLPITQIPPRDEGFSLTREFYRLDDKEGQKRVASAGVGEVVRGHLIITVPQERRFVAVEDFIPAGVELINFRLTTEDQTLRREIEEFETDETSYDDFGLRDWSLGSLMAAIKDFLSAPGTLFGSYPELDDEFYSGKTSVRRTFDPDAEESHDDRLFLFKENVSPGIYEFDYFVRALIPGSYHHLPAVVSEMYFPENFSRTHGEKFTVTQ